MLIKMFQVIIKLLGVILVLLGVILVYDARILTKKFFGFGDQNEASHRIKNTRIYHNNYRRINTVFCIRNYLTNACKIC